MDKDIRRDQRFSNYQKALYKLTRAVQYIKNATTAQTNQNDKVVLDEIVKEGLIHRFEYTHELAWNVMKEYAEYQGSEQIRGSRDDIIRFL